jgi:hypothetical protein
MRASYSATFRSYQRMSYLSPFVARLRSFNSSTYAWPCSRFNRSSKASQLPDLLMLQCNIGAGGFRTLAPSSTERALRSVRYEYWNQTDRK